MIEHLRTVVREHEASRPRSLQKTLGPSEAGSPCHRRIGYRYAETQAVNFDTDPWAAIVGTAVHTWLDNAFNGANERLDRVRYLTEVKVTLPGYLTGTADLVDLDERIVIDHKVMGLTSLKRIKAEGPGQQYRTQVHLYAAGLRLAGVDVDQVGIAAWSRSGGLRDAYFWTEPYDEALVEDTLRRLDAIRFIAGQPGGVAMLPTAASFCSWCPYYLPGVLDVEQACPGHVEVRIQPNPTATGDE